MRHRFTVESLKRARRTLVPALLAVTIALPVLSHGAAADEDQPAPVIVADNARTFGPAPSGNPAPASDPTPVIVADSTRTFGAGSGGSRTGTGTGATGGNIEGGITSGEERPSSFNDAANDADTGSREPDTDTTGTGGEGKR